MVDRDGQVAALVEAARARQAEIQHATEAVRAEEAVCAVEAACTVRGRVGSVDLTIGGATAVSRGVGAPLARLFVGVGTGP